MKEKILRSGVEVAAWVSLTFVSGNVIPPCRHRPDKIAAKDNLEVIKLSMYEIIVTDVTQYGSLYCVAGWDINNGGMIRPEPAMANAVSEASRFWEAQWVGPGNFFAVGNVLRFNAGAPPADFPYPHATEDRLFIEGPTSVILHQGTPDQIVLKCVAPGVSPSLQEAFGGMLIRVNSGKAYVVAGARTCSLDAIELRPDRISFYEDSSSTGKRRLRALIEENGVRFDLSVPADAARRRFLSGGIAALDADARASERIHVRIGLCRPFPAIPDKCYAQVNGLFFL